MCAGRQHSRNRTAVLWTTAPSLSIVIRHFPGSVQDGTDTLSFDIKAVISLKPGKGPGEIHDQKMQDWKPRQSETTNMLSDTLLGARSA